MRKVQQLGRRASLFDSLGALGAVGARVRGEEAREPRLDQVVTELPASARGKGGKSFRATVPVWFHAVHAGGVGNISQTIIDDQMNGERRRALPASLSFVDIEIGTATP